MAKAQIMIVEDESIVAKDLQNMLERIGYDVPAVVASGEAAMEKATGTHLDLVLMDIMLRGEMDGVEAAEQLRTRYHVPVIYLTAYADNDTLQRAKITEPYGYITKPFEERELHVGIEMSLYKHKMERELRESEHRFRQMAENIKDGLIIIENGKAVYVNDRACEIFGYPREEIVKLTALDVAAPEERERLQQHMKAVEQTSDAFNELEFWIVRKDGTRRCVHSRYSTSREGDEIAGRYLVMTDIPARKQMEADRDRASRLESIAILAGGIAHDFNNILTAILGNISLARIYEDTDRISERLVESEKACMQAKNLTEQLLTFSKGGAPVKKITSVKELLKNATRFVLRGSNVSHELSISDDLWPAEIDEGQTSQVIQNLVINADQSMPEGGTIKVQAENVVVSAKDTLPLKDGEYVKISIQDQGIGIPEEHLQRIFDPYFSTKQKGSGLGLATVYSVIKNHDGYITVDSQVGIGSTFYAYFPASPGQLPVKEEEENVEIKPVAGRGRVLVMDDEENIRELAREMLGNLGYEVTTAIDGAEAIKLYRDARDSGQPFDAVITDLTVPGGMSGKEAIQQLVKIDPGIKAIVSSGYSNDPIMANFREYKFKGAIAKPYRTRELSILLHEVLRK